MKEGENCIWRISRNAIRIAYWNCQVVIKITKISYSFPDTKWINAFIVQIILEASEQIRQISDTNCRHHSVCTAHFFSFAQLKAGVNLDDDTFLTTWFQILISIRISGIFISIVAKKTSSLQCLSDTWNYSYLIFFDGLKYYECH